MWQNSGRLGWRPPVVLTRAMEDWIISPPRIFSLIKVCVFSYMVVKIIFWTKDIDNFQEFSPSSRSKDDDDDECNSRWWIGRVIAALTKWRRVSEIASNFFTHENMLWCTPAAGRGNFAKSLIVSHLFSLQCFEHQWQPDKLTWYGALDSLWQRVSRRIGQGVGGEGGGVECFNASS